MSERKINLEEILFEIKFKGLTDSEKESIRNGLIAYKWGEILDAMKEACYKTLVLAAENTEACFDSEMDKLVVNQSILDTINQIE